MGGRCRREQGEGKARGTNDLGLVENINFILLTVGRHLMILTKQDISSALHTRKCRQYRNRRQLRQEDQRRGCHSHFGEKRSGHRGDKEGAGLTAGLSLRAGQLCGPGGRHSTRRVQQGEWEEGRGNDKEYVYLGPHTRLGSGLGSSVRGGGSHGYRQKSSPRGKKTTGREGGKLGERRRAEAGEDL